MGEIRIQNQKKKEYLQQFRHLKIEQQNIEEQLNELRADYMGIKSPSFDAMPKSGKLHDLSDYMVKYSDLLDHLRRIRADKWFLQTEILDRIEEMTNPVERRVLHLHYLQGYSLDRTARELGYSYERIRHIHGDALRHFNL